MTFDPALLVPAALLWPLGLALLALLPGWAPRMVAALPLGPLPGLAAAFLAPRDTPVSLPGVLLDGRLAVSDPGALFLGGAAALWFCAGVYGARAMRGDARSAAFALFWNLVLAGNLGVFVAADLASFYSFFALVSLMAYPLVIHDRKPASLRAGSVYIVLAVIGESALLVGFMLAAYGAGGAIGIGEVRASLAAPDADPAILWLLITGFGIKAGLMPLHVWLPVAHPAAPTPASAVLSGAIVKAGIFGLVAFLPFGAALPVTGTVLALLGFAGLFVAALLGLAQCDAKTVLAYSTVSQMGLVMGAMGAALAAGLPPPAVLPATALYALHHGLAKGALFLAVGLAPKCGGAWRGVMLAVLAALALSVAGLPLAAGALAKSAIKEPAGDFGAMLIGLSSLTSGLVLARYLFVLPEAEARQRPALPLTAAVLALAGAALALPWALYPQITGKTPYAGADVVGVIVGAWPLGLALILTVVALAVGLRPPPIPEGDLLEPSRRIVLAAAAAFRAAVATGSSAIAETRRAAADRIWIEDVEKIERVVRDSTAAAVFLLVIAGAVLAAIVT